MLTIKFPRHDPCLSARDLTHTAPAQPGNGEPGVASLGERFSAYRGPRLREHLAASPNSGRERDSLIGAEISLITDLNSLQGRKKFPVRMRRELAHNALI